MPLSSQTVTQRERLPTMTRTPRHLKPVSDAAEALAQYNERMLVCRENQHRWPDVMDWHWEELRGWRRKVINYRRRMTCERCGMVAIDVIDASSGTKEARTYRQPDGYRMPRELQIERSDLRMEMIRRYVAPRTDLPLGPPVVKKKRAPEESSSGNGNGRVAQ
jgi:hypothetical protein